MCERRQDSKHVKFLKIQEMVTYDNFFVVRGESLQPPLKKRSILRLVPLEETFF